MKKLFLAALVILVLAGFLATAIEYDPGYLLLAYGGYTLEASFWIGVLAFFALVFASLLLLGLTGRSWHLGVSMARLAQQRRHRRGQQKTVQGMIAYINGQWAKARKLLEEGAGEAEAPLLNYLMAARASHALADDKAVRRYLGLAERSGSGADIAVALTQAELQCDSGKLEEALATLQNCRRDGSRHPTVQKLLIQVYSGLKDWDSLRTLVPELRKQKLLPAEELDALMLRAGLGQLAQLERAAGEDAYRKLQQWFQQLPRELSHNSRLVAEYARLLLRLGQNAGAEKLLRLQLRRDWQRELVTLYGTVAGDEPDKQLLIAEAWLQERNNDAALLLALGRLSLRNRLWGKAREYFESSYRLERSPEACAELGRLLANLGEHEKSNHYFQEGLTLSAQIPADLPMPRVSSLKSVEGGR